MVLRPDESPPQAATGIRVSYDVVDLASGARSTEVLELDRPLRSRRTSGGTGSATTGEGVFDRAGGVWRQVAVVPPGEAGHDLRLTAPLAWAAEQGLARVDGQGEVGGRRCTWWLTREPLDAGPFAAATDADRARSCVDADGLLLSDTWRVSGRDVRRRDATEVRPLRTLDVFDGSKPQAIPMGLVLMGVERVPEAVSDLVALSPPRGLVLRAAARVAELEPGSINAVRRSARAVYASERDVLVVDQVRGPFEPRGTSAPLGDLGVAQVQATAGGLLVTVRLAPEQHVRVRTSLPYADVQSWLLSLRRV